MPDFIRTLRLKVRPESYRWLNAAAVEVNQVFNFANEASRPAMTPARASRGRRDTPPRIRRAQ